MNIMEKRMSLGKERERQRKQHKAIKNAKDIVRNGGGNGNYQKKNWKRTVLETTGVMEKIP